MWTLWNIVRYNDQQDYVINHVATTLQIITFFIALIILLLFILYNIILCGWNRVFSIPFLLKILFFLILVRSFLLFISIKQSKNFSISWLQVFRPKLLRLRFFDSQIPSLNLSRSVLKKEMTLKAIEICISNHNIRSSNFLDL